MPSILANPLVSNSGDVTALAARVTAAEGDIVTLESDTSGVHRTAITFAASPYAVVGTDTFLSVDATGGNVAINLRAVASGRTIRVLKIDSSGNTVTVYPNGAETVDNAASYVLSEQNAMAAFHPSTSKYIIEAD
jgi:hypothetical protein